MAEKYRLHEADERQNALVEAELALGKTHRLHDLLSVLALLLVLGALAVAYLIVPDKTVSESENRSLQTMPRLTWQSLTAADETAADGTRIKRRFTSLFEDYMSDQFPLREASVSASAALHLGIGMRESGGVIAGKDGYLVARMDGASDVNMKKNVAAIARFAACAETAGVPVTTAFAGRLADVADSVLPALYPADAADAIWDELDAAAHDGGLDYLDLRAPLAARFLLGESVYYRTDHHWTTLGALYAYNAIADSLGAGTRTVNDYRIEVASENFYGTTWSSAGMHWVAPDKMYYFRYDGDENYTVTFDDGSSRTGFYDRAALGTKDQYASFISDNRARVDIRKDTDEPRPVLLLVKDSFAHCMIPFLAETFDLIVIDVRSYGGAVADLLKSEPIDRVLILYNMDTLVTENSIVKLIYNLSRVNADSRAAQ